MQLYHQHGPARAAQAGLTTWAASRTARRRVDGREVTDVGQDTRRERSGAQAAPGGPGRGSAGGVAVEDGHQAGQDGPGRARSERRGPGRKLRQLNPTTGRAATTRESVLELALSLRKSRAATWTTESGHQARFSWN